MTNPASPEPVNERTKPMAIETAAEFAARLDNEVENGLLCYDDLARETEARDAAVARAARRELLDELQLRAINLLPRLKFDRGDAWAQAFEEQRAKYGAAKDDG